jgi:serine/threonine protein phosphatase 1
LKAAYDKGRMNPQLTTFEANTQGRDFAVGDIHGHFGFLQVALDTIGFSPATDRLFSVGDLVDRGPESHQVLDWLNKPWFHAIAGNHDFMTWRRALQSPYPLVDHLRHGGEWLDALSLPQQKAVGERLRDLPIAAQVHTAQGLIGLVHADCPFDNWADMQAAPLMPDVEYTCLWSIERHRRRYAGIVRGVRAVVHGHMTLPAMQVLGNVYYIDTGGWLPNRGHFTLLDLASLKASAVQSSVRIPKRYL